MRLTATTILAICLLTAPLASAQSSPELRLPQELDKALRQMMEQMKPALKEMFRMMETFEGIDDPRHYQMPEILPNGDIIIRRRDDAPPFAPRNREEPPADEERDAPKDGTTKT